MATSLIVPLQRLVVQPGLSFKSLALPIDPLTSHIAIRIPRPTSRLARAFGVADRVKIATFIELDGIEQYASLSQMTGGIRLDGKGRELTDYVHSYEIPWGFFGQRSGVPVRLGELSKTSYFARFEITSDAGSIDDEIEIIGLTAPAPAVTFKNSVAFDTASSVLEISGDGVINITHTASGSNRAAFFGAGSEASSGNAQTSFTATYNGNSATAIWNVDGAFSDSQQFSGLRLLESGIPTGAQSVVITAVGGATPGTFGGGVMTMTGVDQTTPVGTQQTTTATSGTTPSVTVGSVGTNDLVTDMLFGFTSSTIPAVGAAQTSRWAQLSSSAFFCGSTQAGTDGGVMSWSKPSGNEYMLGAVAFKPSAAAGAFTKIVGGTGPGMALAGFGGGLAG